MSHKSARGHRGRLIYYHCSKEERIDQVQSFRSFVPGFSLRKSFKTEKHTKSSRFGGVGFRICRWHMDFHIGALFVVIFVPVAPADLSVTEGNLLRL